MKNSLTSFCACESLFCWYHKVPETEQYIKKRSLFGTQFGKIKNEDQRTWDIIEALVLQPGGPESDLQNPGQIARYGVSGL